MEISAGLLLFLAALPTPTPPPRVPLPPVSEVTVAGHHLVNHGLVGVGRIPAAATDKFGETFGSLSAMTFDLSSWRRDADGSYSGTLYTQPDRGYNNPNTIDYRGRIQSLAISFTPAFAIAQTQDQVRATVSGGMLLTEYDGSILTGLNATAVGNRPGFPPLPMARNGRISLDGEGIARLKDGSFFVADEYGPYLYKFSPEGILETAVRPPEALIPKRKGVDAFDSNNPEKDQAAPDPVDPETGRQNNQGFEGLSLAPDGRTLFAILQSATRQDGGEGGGTAARRNTRLLAYDIGGASVILKAEYLVALPTFEVQRTEAQLAALQAKAVDKTVPIPARVTQAAATSEIVALSGREILVLARDSGSGHTSATSATSVYRKILVYDLDGATNIAGTKFDDPATPAAPKGVVDPAVVPARGVEFIDLNDASQLAKYRLHNGPKDDENNLSEKWESMALVPTLDPSAPNDYFLFVGNDNDFITAKGFQAGEAYSHPSGMENDTMLLVWRVSL